MVKKCKKIFKCKINLSNKIILTLIIKIFHIITKVLKKKVKYILFKIQNSMKKIVNNMYNKDIKKVKIKGGQKQMKALKKILTLSIVGILIGTNLTLADTIEPPIVNPPRAIVADQSDLTQLQIDAPIVYLDIDAPIVYL